MTALNRCVPDGWVVGAASELPVEPSDFGWPDRKPGVGCNHLVCLHCKAELKSQVGFHLELDWEHRERVTERAILMHTSEDWSRIDGIKTEKDFRLYTCRCFHHAVFQGQLTFDPDSINVDGSTTRHLPWTCAGHPALTLPVTFGDRTVPDIEALSAVVVDAATDSAKAGVVLGLYWRSQHGSLEAIVQETLQRVAVGPQPLSSGLKALFEAQTRLAPLNSFFEELIRYQVGIARPEANRREQLVDILASSIWQRPSGMPEVGTLQILRDESLAGFATSSQLRMFEALDREWLMAHADELLAKNSDRAGGILVRAGRVMLFDPDRAAAMRTLTALARKTGVPAERLVAQAQDELGVLVVDSAEILAAIGG